MHNVLGLSCFPIRVFLELNIKDSSSFDHGVIVTARIENELDRGAPIDVRAKTVVYAVGAWANQKSLPYPESSSLPISVRPTKGVHIIVDAQRLPVRHAVVMKSPRDGRVVYALPLVDSVCSSACRTMIGTTDTDFSGAG